MAYDVVQKIRGKYYLYRVTEAVWDSGKKNSRQKREYIGPCDADGNLQDDRRKTKQAVPPHTSGYSCRTVGPYHFLVSLAEKTGLKGKLEDAFGKERAGDILAMAVLRIADPSSLRLVGDIMDSAYLAELLGTGGGYSSQRLSEMLSSIGRDAASRTEFSRGMLKGTRAAVFDTTVLQSESRLMDLLEYGRKYKATGLPQVNMGYVHSLDAGIPVYYKLFPGSISDSVTVCNLIRDLEGMGSSVEHLVLDRGFYSESNFREMYRNGYGFTIPVSSARNIFKAAVSEALDDLDNPMNTVRYRGRTESFSDRTAEMPFSGICGRDGEPVAEMRILVFQNFDRRKDGLDTLFSRICGLEADASRTEWSEDAAESLFSGKNADCRKLFSVSRRDDGKVLLERKRNAVSFAMRNCGRLVLLTTSAEPAMDVLELYRTRDCVEKDFEALKDDMGGGIGYIHNRDSAEGMVFIQFVATGLRMSMRSAVRESDALRRMDIPLILRKLNLMSVVTAGGQRYLTEVTKAQRTIYGEFGIGLPEF